MNRFRQHMDCPTGGPCLGGSDDCPHEEGTTMRSASEPTYTLRQRTHGGYVGKCRICGAQEVHGEAAWAERLISIHVDQVHTPSERNRRVTNEYLTKGVGMEDSEALLTGTITALLMRYASDDPPFQIERVEPIMDGEGNYSNMIRVSLASGTQLIVHVTETNP